MSQKIGIIGAGAWGTAMASPGEKGQEVELWALEADVESINTVHENKKFLPGFIARKSDGLRPTSESRLREGLSHPGKPVAYLARTMKGC